MRGKSGWEKAPRPVVAKIDEPHRLGLGVIRKSESETVTFVEHGSRDALTSFRIFNYPPPASPELSGVLASMPIKAW
jgi:hypothetical protein